jgi:hypothetical protein
MSNLMRDHKVGEGTIPMTQAMVFSADDGCDVGQDSGAPASQDYGSRGNAFNGTVKGVQLEIGEAAESSDHLVSPEEAVRIAMAPQSSKRAPVMADLPTTAGRFRGEVRFDTQKRTFLRSFLCLLRTC